MKQYEKATAPRNRNRRNGPRGSARASRDLLRHSNRAGLPWSAPGLCGAAGVCSARVCGVGPAADLPAGRGRASAGLLRAAAGGLLRVSQSRLEASASALRASSSSSFSSLTTGLGNAAWWKHAGKRRETWNRRARIENDPRFLLETFSAPGPKADCKRPVTLPSFSGQKGYAGTRNQRHAAYTP